MKASLNFFVTNRIPRRTATRFMAWLSRVEHPLLTAVGLRVWQFFGGRLDLHEAKKTAFSSIHDCFVRELKDGARPFDPRPDVIVSPCDAVVGEHGSIAGGQLVQAKGIRYRLDDLVLDPDIARQHRDGVFVTLRLRSTMYHRFHAPFDADIQRMIYVPGDTWNVNPITLQRMPRVFCLNERLVMPIRLRDSLESLTLVPVAAILVAGIHVRVADVTFNLQSPGPRDVPCRASVQKGDELGHFLHGSTIVVLGTRGLTLDQGLTRGQTIRTGEPLMRLRRSHENTKSYPSVGAG